MYVHRKLKDICRRITDGTHQAPEWAETGVPFIFVSNIKDGQIILETKKFVSDSTYHTLTRACPIEVGDVLYTAVGSYGNAAAVATNRRFLFQRHVAHIKPLLDCVDPRFLAFALNSPSVRRQADRVAKGAAQKTVTLSDLKEFLVPCPPLTEQRRIATIFGQVDKLRQKRRNAIVRLGALAPSIFADMFGVRRISGPKLSFVSLGSKIDFLTSGSRGWAEFYEASGAKFLRIQNVRRDELDLSDIAFVNAPSTAEAQRTRVRGGDVLLSITADLGRTAAVPNDIGEAYINQHLAIIRSSALLPRFLSAALASGPCQADIQKKNREGVKAGLNFDDVRSILIPDASLSDQHRLAGRLYEVDRIKASYETHLAKLGALFVSLEELALNGELTLDRAASELEMVG
jgi:type I restriction enzyme S subunit